MKPTWPRVFDAFVMTALFGASALALPGLPARIPTHFGFDGTPDAWTPTTALAWFALPLTALALAALLHGMPALLERRPNWVRLPDGRPLGALPRERRPLVMERIRALFDSIAGVVTVSLSLLQLAVHVTANGGNSRGVLLVVLLLGPIVLALAVLASERIDSALRRSA